MNSKSGTNLRGPCQEFKSLKPFLRVGNDTTYFTIKLSFILVLIIALIVIPFNDISNIFGWLKLASYVSNREPMYFGISWPGGPFFAIILVPLYLIYSFSNFNLYFTILSLKVILLLFVIMTSVLLYSLTKVYDSENARKVLIFSLLNPAILAISFEFTQLDIISVFFVTLSYYILNYKAVSTNKVISEAFGIFALMIAVFFDYYPLLLIPTIIIFTNGAKSKIRRFSITLIEGGFLYLITNKFFRGSYNYLSSLSGSTVTSHGLIDLPHYVHLPVNLYYFLIVVIAIVVPIAVKRYKYNESASSLIVISLLLFISPAAYENNFLWLLPFAVLILVEGNASKVSYKALALAQLFILVGIVGLNIYDGTGTSPQQGIFYFGYMILHMNVIILSTQHLYNLFFQLYNVVLPLSLTATIAFCISVSVRKSSVLKTGPRDTKFPNQKESILSIRYKDNNKRISSWKKMALLIVVFLLILSIASYSFNNSYTTYSNHNDVNNFPVAILSPGYNGIPGDFAIMNVPNQTFKLSGDTIQFNKESSSINMSRTLDNQSISIVMLEQISNIPPGYTPLVDTSTFDFGVARLSLLSSGNVNEIIPATTSNTKLISANNSHEISSFTFNSYLYSRNSSSSYDMNNSFMGESVFFAFKQLGLAKVLTIPLYMENQNYYTEFALTGFNTGEVAYYDVADKEWRTFPVQFGNESIDGWNYVLVTFKPNYTNISIDGQTKTLQGDGFLGNSTLYLGNPWWGGSNGNYSFYGYLSGLMLVKQVRVISNSPSIYLESGDSVRYFKFSKSILLGISDRSNETTVKIDRTGLNFSGSMSSIVFGKLTSGNYSVNITLLSYNLYQGGKGNFYLIPTFFAFSIPYMTTFFYFYRCYRKKYCTVYRSL